MKPLQGFTSKQSPHRTPFIESSSQDSPHRIPLKGFPSRGSPHGVPLTGFPSQDSPHKIPLTDFSNFYIFVFTKYLAKKNLTSLTSNIVVSPSAPPEEVGLIRLGLLSWPTSISSSKDYYQV